MADHSFLCMITTVLNSLTSALFVLSSSTQLSQMLQFVISPTNKGLPLLCTAVLGLKAQCA